MEEQKRPLDAEARRRRLDELFADEPFLSATMKARRLHEKMQALQTQETETRSLPTQAYVRDIANGGPRFANGTPEPVPPVLPEMPPNLESPSVLEEPPLQEEPLLQEASFAGEDALVQAEPQAEETVLEEPMPATETVIQREPLRLDEMVSLAEAAGYLRDGVSRGRVSPACAERLLCFRDEVLNRWREGAPEREQC